MIVVPADVVVALVEIVVGPVEEVVSVSVIVVVCVVEVFVGFPLTAAVVGADCGEGTAVTSEGKKTH